MERQWWIKLFLVGALVLSLAGSVRAQGPVADGSTGVQAAVGTAFTYQGYMTDGGRPANGLYDFAFALYADLAGTQWVTSAAPVNDAQVTNGLFTALVDLNDATYGDVHFYLNGEARYLRISVRPGASTGAYTFLTPLQELTPVPYAQALPGLHTVQNATSPNVVGGYAWNSVGVSSVGQTIGGGGRAGSVNTVSADYGTVSGGEGNTASRQHATVAGGRSNTAAGTTSFAAGHRAKANNQGCFVWGDSTDADVSCNSDNRWVARASGGVYFYTNAGLSSGVRVLANGSSWGTLSDRNVKTDVVAVDYRDVLQRLADQVPVTTWRYKSQDTAARHMGPMAQDFYAAFGLGEDDLYLETIDVDGVALAAIQGLYQLSQEQEAQIATLQARVDGLEARMCALEAARSAARTGELRGPGGWWLVAALAAMASVLGRRWLLGGGR